MTKYELLHFLEPFTDEVKLINARGEELVATYIMSYDGEGLVVLASLDDDANKAIREPKNL